MAHDFRPLKAWIGRSVPAGETATAAPVARLAATLGMPVPAAAPGDALPPGWHGIYFPPTYGPDRMREDGSAAGGGLTPPIPLARYRLGLDRSDFPGTLRIGDELRRTTTIADIRVREEDARSVVHMVQRSEITGPRGLAVVEEREYVYFDGEAPAAPPAPALPARMWQQSIDPTPVLLFRYSACRFNSHRVHYDRDYAMKVEKLPGLIVQSTLVAQLLLEMCRREMPDRRIVSFSPRTRRPVYDTGPFTLQGAPTGQGALLWATDATGFVCMTGEVQLDR